MKPVIIVHHHEITLKGNNRRYFEQKLLQNMQLVLSRFPGIVVSGGYGRNMIHIPETVSQSDVVAELKLVFGLANICPGFEVEQNMDLFKQATEALLRDRSFVTMRVDTRRSDKQFEFNSAEVNIEVGAFIVQRFGSKGKMVKPDITVYIEIASRKAYLYTDKLSGAGGLPAAISGKVVSLISAGFDSPVASWRMMRRGCTAVFVHFHSMPYTTQYAVDQVRELVKILTRYQFRSRLYVVPFAAVQQEIVLHCPPPLRVVLYRRMMIRIADAIARKEGAEALVTGEAIGQVASQTLRNVRAIDDAAVLPILRPLAGADKEETMDHARAIGTHDISKEPYDDCCSFLAPRSPETWAKMEEVITAEQQFDVKALMELAMKEMTVETFKIPALIIQQDLADDNSLEEGAHENGPGVVKQ